MDDLRHLLQAPVTRCSLAPAMQLRVFEGTVGTRHWHSTNFSRNSKRDIRAALPPAHSAWYTTYMR